MTVQHKFAINLSNLQSYVDQRIEEILPMLFTATRFLDNVTIEEGVKGTVEWYGIELQGELRNKSGCGFVDSATYSFKPVQLTTTIVGIDTEICRRDLNGKWTQLLNPRGAQAELESLSFPDYMTLAMVQLAASKWQRLLILGDTLSTTVDIMHHNGLAKLLCTTAGVGTVSASGVNWNDHNSVYDYIEDFALSFPEEARDNPNINIAVYVGKDVYEKVRRALFERNYYHIAPTSSNVGTSRAELMLPRSEVMLRKFKELDQQPNQYTYNDGNGNVQVPSSKVYGVVENYIIVGTDSIADYQDFNLWYETSTRTIRGSIHWRSGLAVWRPELFLRSV